MSDDDIMNIALEAGFYTGSAKGDAMLKQFAFLIAATEREECARICDEFKDEPDDNHSWERYNEGWMDACNVVAWNIRAKD